MSKPRKKSFHHMSDAQREAEWREIDALGEIPLSGTRPPTKKELAAVMKKPTRAQYEAKRGRGRPRLGGVGAKSVLISIEPSLLKRVDAYAKKNRMSRSALFSRAVAQTIGG